MYVFSSFKYLDSTERKKTTYISSDAFFPSFFLFFVLHSFNFCQLLGQIFYLFQYTNQKGSCSLTKHVLRNVAKFPGKCLCQSLFLNKVADLSLQLYLKETLRNF